jgi:hypothetical protein
MPDMESATAAVTSTPHSSSRARIDRRLFHASATNWYEKESRTARLAAFRDQSAVTSSPLRSNLVLPTTLLVNDWRVLTVTAIVTRMVPSSATHSSAIWGNHLPGWGELAGAYVAAAHLLGMHFQPWRRGKMPIRPDYDVSKRYVWKQRVAWIPAAAVFCLACAIGLTDAHIFVHQRREPALSIAEGVFIVCVLIAVVAIGFGLYTALFGRSRRFGPRQWRPNHRKPGA